MSTARGERDGGTNSRVFSTILTWMQERKKPVFVVATANKIESLAPELLRKGRFDEIFFIDLPTPEERYNIFRIHLAKFHQNGIKNLDELVNNTRGFNGAEIEETVKCHVQAKIEEYDINATIVDVAVTGSRCRGLEHEGSDLDVVVELSTAEREDDLFNAFNEDGLHIGEVKVDINPITAQRTGTLETYLPQVEEYLEGVRQAREQEKEKAEVTLTVSECGEFHNLGECYENIPTVDEAIAIWKQIPSERMNGIPAIGINILGRGAEPYEDYEIDVLSGKRIDLGVLDYVPDIKNNPQAMEVITELVAKLPDMEIDGVMSEEMEARVWELRMPDLPQEEQLAVELDRLSYDYDTVLYHDSTRNMTENVSELAASIANIKEHAVENVESSKQLMNEINHFQKI